MMDPDAFKDFVDDYFFSAVLAANEDGNHEPFKELLTAIRKLYRAIEPSSVRGSITVFATTAPCSEFISETFHTLGSFEELQSFNSSHLCLEIVASGDVRRWNIHKLPDYSALSVSAFVYSYRSGVETFWSNGEQFGVRNIHPGNYSLFQLPVYRQLEQALAEYRHRVVRLSECEILKDIWFDDLRLFLKAKPESTMRKSLVRFLRWQLRADAEVMPEQNVDESHPIDIRVTFDFANRVALIEIKWLGCSKNSEGKPTTSYGEARANKGASQLADYLDWFFDSLPTRIARGYLVVFDCRRRLSSNPTSLENVDGLYFSDREIEYEPLFHKTRNDFAEPIRMFAEPICD